MTGRDGNYPCFNFWQPGHLILAISINKLALFILYAHHAFSQGNQRGPFLSQIGDFCPNFYKKS